MHFGTRCTGLSLTLMAAAAIGCADDPAGGTRAVDATRAEIRAAVAANGQLAGKLMSALRERPGNLIYSPLSLEAVLGMLYAGARGETAAQLGSLLGAADDASAFHTGLGDLLTDLGASRGYTLDLAHRLFLAQDVVPLPEFSARMRDAYRAPQQTLDFASDPERARGVINDWVAAQTHGQIDALFQAGEITPRTVLAVVNALSFKATWTHGFDRADTAPGSFHKADGTEVTVPIMNLPATSLRSALIGETTLLELPYDSGELAFLVWLPATWDGVPALEQSLSELDVAAAVAQLSEHKQGVAMPRCTLASRLDWRAPLEALGVSDLFDGERADLTGIADREGWRVDPLVQEARIAVDEDGTVASVATAAGLQTRGGALPLRLDHPFVFMVYDRRTSAVILTGRVVDPS